MIKDLLFASLLMIMVHLTIGRTIGAMWISMPVVRLSSLSRRRRSLGLFVWFMMVFWVKLYFYRMIEGTVRERQLKVGVMCLILLMFEFFVGMWLHKYMAWGWALLIVFVVENILSFPLFILLRCPGYQYLQR